MPPDDNLQIRSDHGKLLVPEERVELSRGLSPTGF
jgi:hypothetical protein